MASQVQPQVSHVPADCVQLIPPTIEAFIHDLQAIHLGSLVRGDCIESQESETDILHKQGKTHGQHPYPGIGVDLDSRPAATCSRHHHGDDPSGADPVLGGEPLGQGELAAPLHLVELVAHFAFQTFWIICTFHEPSSQAVVVDDPNISLAPTGLDHAPSICSVVVVTDPTLQCFRIIRP